MNQSPRNRDSIDKAVGDIKAFAHRLLTDEPAWTGHFTVHAKEGVILDIEATRRYKINR